MRSMQQRRRLLGRAWVEGAGEQKFSTAASARLVIAALLLSRHFAEAVNDCIERKLGGEYGRLGRLPSRSDFNWKAKPVRMMGNR